MKKQRIYKFLLDLLMDIGGGVLYAIGIDLFAKNANFAPGGVSGLALIVYHLCQLPVGLGSLLLNIPLVLISFRYVGRRFLYKTLRSVIVCTILLDLVFIHVPSYTGSPLLAAIYSGVFLGAGLALFYLHGSSSGGSDLLTMSIKVTRPHLSIGFVTMLTDMVVICLGWPVFGNVDAVLYGLVSTAATSLVMDRILNGASMGILVLVVTQHGQAIAEEINRCCQRGATLLSAQGSYTGASQQVVMCACTKSEAHKVRTAAYRVDHDAFVVVSQTNEIFGAGFISPDQTTAFL